MLKIIGNILTR